ncbi:uncharacterized protein LOC142180037 [Nicotiana tabacum]|uniref:Uncharacterized protein LOC142180037 n=1 Tax=Nicotiana tabacum TaxID=4097 RepID=A0AC58UC41_TOBAC
MNLFGPTRTASIGGRKYAFVIVDNFSRFTWVIFFSHKDEALRNFEVFCNKVHRKKGNYISAIRSDHGGELESRAFENFCNDQGISYNFSSPRSPQQNRVVEPQSSKFDPKSDEGTFLGYSPSSRAYRVFNKRTLCIKESIHVVFVDTNPHLRNKKIPEDEEISIVPKSVVIGKDTHDPATNQQNQSTEEHVEIKEPFSVDQSTTLEKEPVKYVPNEWKSKPGYPHKFIIGNPQECFKRGNIDTTLFIKHSNSGEFKMSRMGELTLFLGLQIKKSSKGIFISQTKYTKELIKKFGMENAKPIATPMGPTTTLEENKNGKTVDEIMYRGMIGSILYLTVGQPDIMFSVCKCVRFQSAPNESHFTVVKRIIRYLIGTTELGIWYAHSNNSDLKGFSDADFAGDRNDRKSTSGTWQLLENALIFWHSKKQNCVALSTTEAEYLAVGSSCTQILWIMHQLLDYDLNLTSTLIFCDNTSAICLSKNSVHHSSAKNKEIKHHFIRDHVAKGDNLLEFISTESQLADIFTKPLLEERFCLLRKTIGIMSIGTGLLSTFTTRDSFVLYYLVNNKRLDWFLWIRQYMLGTIRDISSSAACLPYCLLISHILEVESPPVQVEPTTKLTEPQSTATTNLQQIQQGLDGVQTVLTAMKEHVDKIREVTKEIGTDVAKLRMDMGATRRQGIRPFNSMTEKMNKITKEVETSNDSLCTKKFRRTMLNKGSQTCQGYQKVNKIKYIKGNAKSKDVKAIRKETRSIAVAL